MPPMLHLLPFSVVELNFELHLMSVVDLHVRNLELYLRNLELYLMHLAQELVLVWVTVIDCAPIAADSCLAFLA